MLDTGFVQHAIGYLKVNPLLAVLLGGALVGCSDDNSTNAGEDLVLARISGNEQVVARKDTSAPLVVLLTDTQGVPSSRSHILTLDVDT